MYNEEVGTIAKSLPLLRRNTHKSLILSYSEDFGRIFRKNTTQRCGDFSKTEGSTFYFQSPLPYLCTCTITVDAKRKDPVEERKSERQMKIETSRKFLDLYDYRILISEKWIQRRLTNVLKNGNRIQEWHSLQRNSGERRVWLVHASCIVVFSKAVQPSMKVVVGVYINDFFLAVEYANKIVRQIKEWCLFWSVSLQPTKRSTFPHAVLLRHERVACHCFMSFGLCDKKWNCELWL